MRHRARSIPAVLTVLLVVVLVGCAPEIKRITDASIANASSGDRVLRGQYWKARGLGDREEIRAGERKVAIAEFTLEFVRERTIHVPDSRNQTYRLMHYPAELRQQLPQRLYEVFTKQMEDRGWTIVPKSGVGRAAPYARYRTRSSDTAETRLVSPVVNDAGRISIVETYAAPGLAVLEGNVETEAAAVDRELLEALDATIVLRCHFRVGVFKGSGSVEEGSVITVTDRQRSGTLTSQRTLLSESSVLQSRQLYPSVEGDYFVSTEGYIAQISPVLLRYVDLAIQMIR